MFPAAPAQMRHIIVRYPHLTFRRMSETIYQMMNPTATIRKSDRKSFDPSSIPHAIPRFSMNWMRNQGAMTICSPSVMWVLTHIFIIWSMTSSATMSTAATTVFLYFTVI